MYRERGRVVAALQGCGAHGRSERDESGRSETWLRAQWKTRVSLPLAAFTSSGIRAAKLPLAKWCDPAMCAW